MAWYDPRDGGRGEVSGLEASALYGKDPLGDAIAVRGRDEARGEQTLELRDAVTGARLGLVPLADRHLRGTAACG